MRESISPMKKVKPNSRPTPVAEFLNFSMANMKPKAPAKKMIKLMPVPIRAMMPVDTPIQAPSTVGIIDTASRA